MVAVETRGEAKLGALAGGFDKVAKSAKRADRELAGGTTRLKNFTSGAQKAAMGLRDLNQDGLGNLVDVLQIADLGPLGAGMVALAAGAGGAALQLKALSAGIDIMIERDKALKKATDDLNTSTDDLTVSYTEMMIGSDTATRSAQGLDGATQLLSAGIDGTVGALRKYNTEAINGATKSKGLRQGFELIADIAEASIMPLSGFANGLAYAGDVAEKAGLMAGNGAAGFRTLAGAITSASNALKDLASTTGGKFAAGILGLGSKVKGDWEAKRTAQSMKEGKRAQQVAKGFGGGSGGGGGGTGGGTVIQSESQSIGGFGFGVPTFLDLAIGAGVGGQGVKTNPGRGLSLGKVGEMTKLGMEMEKTAAKGRALQKSIASIDAVGIATDGAMRNLGKSIGGSLVTGFQNMASAAGGFFGAMAAGTATLSGFGDAILDMFGQMASQIGQFFITTGTGFLFMPGGQAQGAGMIAAGVGMSALGGFLGGKGSGNKGSGSSAGSAGAFSANTGPSLPRNSGGPSTIIIPLTIAGHTIDPLVVAVDAAARRGALRHIATR